jgi:UDP-3-O-[3-hydroxymyristoyl] glucosamine N-acyltransferase
LRTGIDNDACDRLWAAAVFEHFEKVILFSRRSMKEISVKDLAALVNGEVRGDKDKQITGVSNIEDAGPHDVTFIANPKYRSYLSTTRAGAIVVAQGVEDTEKTLIVVDDPYLSFARIITHIKVEPRVCRGIMPGAYIAEDASVGNDVSIYPNSYVGSGASIGDRVTIYPGVFVGDGARIGEDSVLYPNVCVYQDCILGKRVTVHSGAVIGADGFGFAPDGEKYYKIPQVGIVEIGDDVEIGAGTTIDRATLGRTVISAGTKIDNLVQIAHNVSIGENTIVVSQTGISGSTKLGRHVIIGGQVGIVGHIEIGDNAMIGSGRQHPGRQRLQRHPGVPSSRLAKII